ncbi:MAG TPA: hypothetical protein PK668_00705 [Myxococcota bacterium]|nr:hypothetical protein [Myxococcota bacterium]HRY95648.1 hypothetical protein [Myxococcota bacterium]HSA23112.1 hypothetical protein [Myxococcota bacterium]
MNRLLCGLVGFALLLPAPAPAADLAELLSPLPADVDLVIAADLGAWGRYYKDMWAEIDALPAVAENPEVKNLLGMQRTLLESALGTLKSQYGVDLLQDLGWAAIGVSLAAGGEPRGVGVLLGKIPGDLPKKVDPELQAETRDGREIFTKPGAAFGLEAGRRILAANDAQGLSAALAAKEIAPELARKLPELTAKPGAEHLFRLAVAVPAVAREELLRDPSVPVATLVGGLRWLQADVSKDGVQLVLGCEGAPAAQKARRLLQGIGESFLAGTYVWRAYAYAALALDLGSMPELPPQVVGMLKNRPALVKTIEALLPRPEGKPDVQVSGALVRLVVPSKLTRGGLMITGVLAAVAIPAFIDYTRKAKESEGRENLRTLARAEELYFTERGAYKGCARVPLQTPGKDSQPWPGDKCFEELGFKPLDPVYFSYEVEQTGDGFAAYARCDLDLDGRERVLRYDSKSRQVEVLTPDAW